MEIIIPAKYSGYSIRFLQIYDVNRNGNNYSC